jgi:hypothetical protein
MRVFLVFLFIVTAVCGGPVNAEESAPPPECDIHHSPCTQVIGEVKVTLDILPKPVRAMEDLCFEITLLGAEPASDPYVDLGMPGMNMGPNRVHLRPTGEGRYEGRGVIVRCPSGRRTWEARVTVPGRGEASFVFDVVY